MDAFLGFLNNGTVLTIIGLGWGVLCKFWAPLAKIPNATIPFFNAALALLVKLSAPAEAHAATLLIVGGASFWGTLAASIWQSATTSLYYEIFGRHALDHVLAKPQA
jgi:hypothetical protein